HTRTIRTFPLFHHTSTPYIYTLSLHDALPILGTLTRLPAQAERKEGTTSSHHGPYVQGNTRATMVGTAGCELAIVSQSLKANLRDRKSTRLNSSHVKISYAVFCLKKKKKNKKT